MDGPSGPVLDWPEGWDAHSLAEHRQIVARHFRALGAITSEESAVARGALVAMLGGAR